MTPKRSLAMAAAAAIALVAVPTASAAAPVKTVTAGDGLSGGGDGPTVTLAVATGGITNAMLANPMFSLLAGAGLTGGGTVPLGGSTTLGIADGGVTPAHLSAAGSAAGDVLTSDGSTVSWASPPSANAWSLTGNAGTTSANFLGTTDNQPLELRVDGARALRIEPATSSFFSSSAPNILAGSSGNSVGAGSLGATISGGAGNRVSGSLVTVAGGYGNSATGFASAVGSGESNQASARGSYIGGGHQNRATADQATVGGGSGNTASGWAATVPGGHGNIASAFHSFAAGSTAKSSHWGSFVFADAPWASNGTCCPLQFLSTADNEFAVRATGGVRFVSEVDRTTGAPTSGVSLAPGGGSWLSHSDRALKRDLVPVDGSWLLRRLAGLPISTWSYKAQKPSVRHLGPTAQDFARAFGLGEDSRRIASIDSEGVSLAGVQALYKLVQAQQTQLRAQQRELDALKADIAKLQRARAASLR